MRKSSTKKPTKGKGKSRAKTRAELRAQLARDLASVINNPEMPTPLQNGITDAILEFQSDCVEFSAVVYSAEAIGKALELFAEKGGAR